MANKYHQIYLQVVFAVKYRAAVLDKSWRKQVFAVMGNLIDETKCKTLKMNGVEDHLHCFVGLRSVFPISELIKSVIGKSSGYINDLSPIPKHIEWQLGFGVLSHHKTIVETIYIYVDKHEGHHKVQIFNDKYLAC